ncbi:MAG: Holliday junction branch migration protein RuvA [Acidobacteria bacterium]|jgi:Holliday junction DNA helicase RuvA|nr:Holliday junction branch migration protein RuvA [Acidobacteriota bacterium]
MITAVRGTVFQLSPGRVAVETGSGVILQLAVPVSSFARLKTGQEVLLHAVLKVKDEDIVLYGFLDPEEKALFEKFVAVSGIGGKTAMACVAAIAPDEWRLVIAAADVARISAIPGIGKKTAQRIILELSGKLQAEPAMTETATRLSGDLVSGLVNLGYAPKGAREVVHRVLRENPGRDDFEGLFKIALKKAKP